MLKSLSTKPRTHTLSQLVGKFETNQVAARFITDRIIEVLQKRQGAVRLPGLGTLKVVKVKGRNRRHPVTKELVYCKPKTTVRFIPSPKLFPE